MKQKESNCRKNKNRQMESFLKWHPAFMQTCRLNSEETEKLKFEQEYLLSSKPMAIDVLIIKKKYATTLLIIRKGFIM